MDKRDFIGKVISIVHKSFGPPAKMAKQEPCDIYSRNDYRSYITESMSLDELTKFEEHCRDCVSCLTAIASEQSENEALYQKTLDLLETIETQGKENVLNIVIKTSKEALKLLKTTGNLLSEPLLMPARGEDDELSEERSIHILQEFEQPPVSIQVSFKKAPTGEGVELNISLLDTQTEEFLPDTEITLTGTGEKQKKLTDKNGKAAFVLSRSGDYQVIMVDGEDQIVKLNVKIS